DQRPARRGRDRRRARAAVSADRRHHDIVGERTRGPADAERRRAAGRPAAVGGGATEPDDERSRTGLCHVALARRRPAHGAPVAGWMLAAGVGAVAGIRGAGVAVVRARRTRVPGRMRARRARAAAHVGGAGIAVVRTGRAVRLENVAGTGGAASGAALGNVTFASGRSTHGARVARRVLAGVADAVALVERAGVGVRRAGGPVRLLGVGRAARARPVAALGHVAFAPDRAADGARIARRVLADGAGAVALVQGAGVAVVGTGRPARLPRTVGGTRRARAGASLGEIAFAGGGAAGVRATRESAVVLAA